MVDSYISDKIYLLLIWRENVILYFV